jgi:arylsulfatase A-like enzyme
MKAFSLSLLFLCLYTTNSIAQQKLPKTPSKPNIILILTDDLGYGDLGVFYQNLRKKKGDRAEPWLQTPNLDQLAESGAMLTSNYCAAPVCAPSRASLMLGQSQGHANVRDNQFDKALEDNYTMPKVLKAAGYATSLIGKWGLQGETADWPAHPLNRGFDYYYGYMRHADGHEHYPKEGLYRKSKEVWENRTEVSAGLDKCYTGDLFTAVAKNWIVKQQQKMPNQPFFMFLAFDNPHAVLELPTQEYPTGGGLKGGLQWIGKPGKMINTATGTVDSYRHPDYANATYDHDRNSATAEVPWPDTFKRYATIVRRIDDQVGDLLQLLKDLKCDQQTMVVFTSDNGPSLESYLPKEFAPNKPDFFNSFGFFDGVKRDVWEGGMRMPTIISWPNGIKAKQVLDQPSTSYDLLPTFAQLAGLTVPIRMDGVSILPQLTGKGKVQHGIIYTEYFEKGNTPNLPEFNANHRGRQRNQMQMIRIGDTVAIRYDVKSATDDFEIYQVTKDPQQVTNLADDKTLVQLQNWLKNKVLQIRKTDTTAKRPYDAAAIPAIDLKNGVAGLIRKTYRSSSNWIPNVTEMTALTNVKVNGGLPPTEILGEANLVVYEGYFLAAQDGVYQFELEADGKGFLKIHDINLIDEDYGYTSKTIKKANLLLKAGYHPITIYGMKTNKGNGSLKLTINSEHLSSKSFFVEK